MQDIERISASWKRFEKKNGAKFRASFTRLQLIVFELLSSM